MISVLEKDYNEFMQMMDRKFGIESIEDAGKSANTTTIAI